MFADCLNHLAEGGWHSIATLGAGLRLIALPATAYFVLPVFALQAFAMHVFAAGILNLPAAEIPTGSERRAAGAADRIPTVR